MKKKVGIIVPTYDRPILLKRTLMSIFEQSYANWSLYIVNDGGDAHEIELILNYCKKKYNYNNEITILSNTNTLGKAAACNIALKNIDTELIVVLNDDDTWTPEFLKASVNELEYRNSLNHMIKGIACLANIYHEEVLEDGAFTHWCETPTDLDIRNFHDTISVSDLLENNLFSSGQFLFYKSVIEKIGNFNESMLIYSDWEFNIRFIAYFDIFRQTQPYVNTYKRFFAVNQHYNNLLSEHGDKLEHYSNKINDLLLRQTTVGENNEQKNITHQLTMQTMLLMRKAAFSGKNASLQAQPGPEKILPINEINQALSQSNQISNHLFSIENKLDAQTKLNSDWFKYLEYKIKNPFLRKFNKAYLLVRKKFEPSSNNK